VHLVGFHYKIKLVSLFKRDVVKSYRRFEA